MARETFLWSLPSRLSYVLWRMPYTGGLKARARAFWRIVVRNYGSEVCGECGRIVGQVWHVDDQLWREVMGGEGGLLCIPCFDRALGARPGVRIVRWTPTVEKRKGRKR